ncbi:MAG: sel1 repeat family protein [Gammaproteobacteria bacterium]|nr:sel1 repeat family protein [Gammaproteobacteria bacterium]
MQSVLVLLGFVVGNTLLAQSDDQLREESIRTERQSGEYRIEEELIVQGERDTIKSATRILRGYDARNMGGYYYKLRMYEKAYPYLLEAAQEGFKMSQARLGYIYQKGLGGVDRDWVKAVGWLGVAASRHSHPEIMNYWKDLKAKIPEHNMPVVEDIIDEYVSKYGSEATGVTCDINRAAGTHIAHMRCIYDDEILYRDPGDSLGIPSVEIDTSVGGGGGGTPF